MIENQINFFIYFLIINETMILKLNNDIYLGFYSTHNYILLLLSVRYLFFLTPAKGYVSIHILIS